tara:strand:+ start:329 stop:1525 length:1197 start_codon:yes stop_codon:yes gene_type:complete
MFKITKLKELILYFFIFVPYLPSFIKNTYTAPYAVIVSTGIFVLIKKKTFPKELIILFILFLTSLILLINGFDFNTLRVLIGYFSIFVIASSTFFICKQNKRINKKLIFFYFNIWFAVGLIQYFINPEFMTSFVVLTKTTYDRGLSSLAPEPSYFASVMIFFIIISYVNNYKFKTSLFLGIFSIIFISSSATGVFVLLGFSLMYFFIYILNRNSIKILILLSLTLIIFYLNIDFFSGTRLHKIILRVSSDPMNIFITDASANARVWHIIGSFNGAFDNYLLPNPVNNFEERILRLIQNNIEYVHPYTIETLKNKPMSGTGQMFFNLGIISLFYFYVLYVLIQKCYKSKAKALFFTLCLFLFMTTAIPLSFPMFGFIYGLLTYQAYKDSYENIPFIRKS